MYCLSLIHGVSQAKCQKSYLLNTLVLQELIINLSLHSRSTKTIIIPTYINILNNYIQNHRPIRLQNRPAEARTFFADHLTAEAKSPGYEVDSDQLNRFLIFKNKMDVPAHYHEAPVQRTPPETNESVEIPPQVPPTPVFAEKTPPVPATPKPNFLTPPPTEEERPKLKRNFFHNWVDSADWKESDLAMMKPKEKERYERFFTKRKAKIYFNEA